MVNIINVKYYKMASGKSQSGLCAKIFAWRQTPIFQILKSRQTPKIGLKWTPKRQTLWRIALISIS